MKLTKSKLLETIRRKNNGWTTYQARKVAGISIRRVNQVWKSYLQSGTLPDIGKKVGRPKKEVKEEEINMIKTAYTKYRVSASTLEKVIERDYQTHIPHNKIHRIMIYLGLAKSKGKKDIRKKNWIRYERRHSLTAIHIDWHFNSFTRLWIFAIIDDASRKILTMIEVDSPTTEMSIEGMKLALKYGQIKQCISDHGSQFTSNERGGSKFSDFLKKHNIKQILCKIKHPQSNGKIERWFEIYDKHRFAFKTIEEFLKWYNEIRPHRSLNFDVLETPEQAFLRKMKAEV